MIIHQGAVPVELENVTGRGVVYQATANKFLLTMQDLARYLVQNGNEIIVEPAPDNKLSKTLPWYVCNKKETLKTVDLLFFILYNVV